MAPEKLALMLITASPVTLAIYLYRYLVAGEKDLYRLRSRLSSSLTAGAFFASAVASTYLLVLGLSRRLPEFGSVERAVYVAPTLLCIIPALATERWFKPLIAGVVSVLLALLPAIGLSGFGLLFLPAAILLYIHCAFVAFAKPRPPL